MRPIDRILFAGGALFICAWLAVLAGQGLDAWFSGDDLMNLYGAWTAPLWGLAGVRPVGALWYRSIFAAAGFDPFPFHTAAWAFLLANCGLTYGLARRLSGRRETAALAALLASYNARFANLYFDTGAIYDVLCYFFYLAALAGYVRVRQSDRLPDGRELAGFLALFGCALGAKEMAVTLPAAVAAYEWLYHPPQSRRPGAVRSWMVDEGRGAIAAGAIAVVYAAAKLAGPAAMTRAPGYGVTFTAAQAMTNARHYLDALFYRYDGFTAAGVLGLWLGMLAVAAVSRSRCLGFAWAFLSLTIVPMLFVDARGGSAIYLCLFGWSLFAACLLTGATDGLGRFLPHRIKAAALFLGVAALLWPFHRFEGSFTGPVAMQPGEALRRLDEALHRAVRRFRPGAHVLVLHAPLRPEVHDLTFLIHLSYGDRSLKVDRAAALDGVPPPEFDYVLDYTGGKFLVLRRP